MKSITILDYTETSNWDTDKQILSMDQFWVNDGVKYVPEFAFTTNDYLAERDITYNISKFNEIDKSKPWFIFSAIKFPFTLNFNNKEQLSKKELFQGFPESVLSELRTGKAYIILSFEQEAYTTSFLDLFYALYKNNPAIPFDKIIHITTAYNMHSVYEDYCNRNNIKERIQIWFSTHSLLGPIGHHVGAGLYKLTSCSKEKKFINFNRMPKSHRVSFTCLLSEFDLLESGYVSLGVSELFSDGDSLIKYVDRHLPQNYGWDKNSEYYQRINSGCKKLINKLPLTIDTDDFVYKPSFGYNGNLTDFYNKSYFSIVSNTHCFLNDELAITINEKEYKPMLYKHPFLLIARPGTLSLLKDLGFKTFDKWFDESYDTEFNDETRLMKLVTEVNRLCKISNVEWDVMLEEMQSTLEHNYNRLVNSVNDIIFLTDFRKILNYAG